MADPLPPEKEKKPHIEPKPEACPYCEYKTVRMSVMARHMNSKHPDLAKNPAGALVRILDGKDDIPDMLRAVAHWLDNSSSLAGKLPSNIVDWLKKEDAKVQLALRVIAVVKVNRVMQLINHVDTLDKVFKTKIEDPAWSKTATLDEVMMVNERISAAMSRELRFLREMSQLGDVDISSTVDKLLQAFGSAGGGAAFELRGVSLPNDPQQREQIRSILSQLDLTGIFNAGRRQPTIDADAESKPGTAVNTK